MKKIVLHTATVSNSNEFLDAGAEVGVGNGAHQISEERGKALVAGHMAKVTEAKARPRKKPAAKPPLVKTVSSAAGETISGAIDAARAERADSLQASDPA